MRYGNFAMRIYLHSPLENKLSDGFVWYANPLRDTIFSIFANNIPAQVGSVLCGAVREFRDANIPTTFALKASFQILGRGMRTLFAQAMNCKISISKL